MTPDNFISAEEIQKNRSIADMNLWLKEQYKKFDCSQSAKEYFRARKGLVKQLMEEVLPVFRYAESKYGLCTETTIQPVIGNQSFDALIYNGIDKYKVEATVAIDGYQEHHRMNILNKEISVPAWGKIEIIGTKHTEHSYQFESIGVSNIDIYKTLVARITTAYNQKISKSYNGVKALIIGFEDFIGFNNPLEISAFKEMLYNIENINKGCFKEVWIVGSSGKFHEKVNTN